MEVLKMVTRQAFTIFLFNPEGGQVASDFVKGHYEVVWIVLMMVAVAMVNIRFWNFSRDQWHDTPISVARAVGEALMHWSLSNSALFLCLEAHKLVYGLFTEFVPAKSPSSLQDQFIKNVMIKALSKLHLTKKGSSVMVPQVRSPYIPFAILLTTSLVAVYLSFALKNKRLTPQS